MKESTAMSKIITYTSTTDGLVDCCRVYPMPVKIDGNDAALCPRCGSLVVETDYSS
jgi:ubiquitin C-terminal hydrolase